MKIETSRHPRPARRAALDRALISIRDALHGGSWAAFATALQMLLDATPRINHRLRTRIAADLEAVEDEIMREIGVGVRR